MVRESKQFVASPDKCILFEDNTPFRCKGKYHCMTDLSFGSVVLLMLKLTFAVRLANKMISSKFHVCIRLALTRN